MRNSIKLLVLFFIVFSSNSFGDNKKNKDLPPGLQKKVERGGELPHGWKKKFRKGYTLDNNVFSHGVILKGRYFLKVLLIIRLDAIFLEDLIILKKIKISGLGILKIYL